MVVYYKRTQPIYSRETDLGQYHGFTTDDIMLSFQSL